MQRSELKNKEFGRLTVIDFAFSKNGRPYWLCKCVCGKEKIIAGYSLIRGSTKSCGCLHDEIARNQFYKLDGKRYGKLLVTDRWGRRLGNGGKERVFWLCECDCGNKKWIRSSYLLSGDTKSCGCSKIECGKTHAHLLHLSDGDGEKKLLFRHYICSARKRGLDFELGFNEFINITSSPCYYCGSLPHKKTYNSRNKKGDRITNGAYIYNGIDRIDNTKGYTSINSVPCCTICNIAKGIMTYDDFSSWIKKIYNYMICGK